MNKEDKSYKTISEVVKILDLKSKKGDSLPTHTLRFWEKEFKQIKPKILTGNRRYYDKKNIELLKKIHFLLKDQGMTIKGVKKINGMDLVGLDLRSAAALIIAGIIAKGSSKIYGLEHLDRGYENFELKLKKLGIKIIRESRKNTFGETGFKIKPKSEDISKIKAA